MENGKKPKWTMPGFRPCPRQYVIFLVKALPKEHSPTLSKLCLCLCRMGFRWNEIAPSWQLHTTTRCSSSAGDKESGMHRRGLDTYA